MNSRIEKIGIEIEKLKDKIANNQTRLRDLERQKTELENAEIVAMVRGVDIAPDELRDFARMFKEQNGGALPDTAVKDYANNTLGTRFDKEDDSADDEK